MKPTFNKTLERDSTLAIQILFEEAFLHDMEVQFGAPNPHRPMFVQYATGENIQFWENEAGLQWLFDRLQEKHSEGPEFTKNIIAEYKAVLPLVEEYWHRKGNIDPSELKDYFALIRKGMINIGLCFYTGLDERTPEEVKKLVVAVREDDEYFVRNDEFVRQHVVTRGGKREYAHLVTPQELLTQIPPESELARRAHGIVLVDGSGMTLSTMADFGTAHPEYEFKDLFAVVSSATEAKGQIAFKGKVSGVVRIVKNRKQADAVGAGDIIVSPMTTPDFIDAMKKAAAFVTDEGGITCHAAIVAREMKKPCVIGTKIATQIFKDGDMVEVDAEKGIVKKI